MRPSGLRADVVVVDASMAVKWVLDEELHAEAIALVVEWEQRSVNCLVPGWFACEVANALYKRARNGGLTLAEVVSGIQSIMKGVSLRDTDVATSIRGVEIAHALGRPASYDAHYLALAESLGCEVWTADERLWNSARGTFSWVRWLGETRDVT